MKNYIRVPYAKSVHGSNEIRAVVDVLNKSTQMGKNVELFEREWTLRQIGNDGKGQFLFFRQSR